MTTKWCQARYARPPGYGSHAHLPRDGARCARALGHDGEHLFARDEPLPDVQILKHLAPAPTTSSILDRALGALREVNDRFLPAHTREHVLAAYDLIKIARDELVADSSGARCLEKESS